MRNDLSHFSDLTLIELYQKDNNALYIGELYKRYALLVYGLSLKYLKEENNAKDAVSEIFELILEKLKTHQISFFKSWLFIVSKNYLIRVVNKQNAQNISELRENEAQFMESEEKLSLNIKEYNDILLQQAISNLNDEQRTCIELFYLQQKSYLEVASITRYDLNKVKSAIQNGKRNLKIFMEQNRKKYG